MSKFQDKRDRRCTQKDEYVTLIISHSTLILISTKIRGKYIVTYMIREK